MPPRSPLPPTLDLELDSTALRALLDRVGERLGAHLDSLPTQPMHANEGGQKLARSLREPLPEEGAPFERLLALLFDRVIPRSLNTASAGYLGYIPGGGLPLAGIADLITDVTNRYVGIFLGAPGLVQLEVTAVAWFASLLGLPSTAGGFLTTGGSLANFSAVLTARRERLPPDFLRGTLYVSEDAHHSIHKAAMLAGFPHERVRVLPTDEHFRLRPGVVEQAIAEDRAAGLQPFLLVGSAGTTATGAVDDLPGLAELASREGLWFHVDAAYGGFFTMTERGREALRGIERADSVTLDPHKSLFLPYGTGCLVVRDVGALRRAHAMTASYLPPMQTQEDFVDLCELSPELSRESRGLRVWLPLKLYGASTFRKSLDEKLDLARWAHRRLGEVPGVELMSEPTLSLFTFRLRPLSADSPVEVEDARNRRWLRAVNARNRVLLTGVEVQGRFLARLCVLSFRTHLDRMEQAIEDLEAGLGEVDGPESG